MTAWLAITPAAVAPVVIRDEPYVFQNLEVAVDGTAAAAFGKGLLRDRIKQLYRSFDTGHLEVNVRIRIEGHLTDDVGVNIRRRNSVRDVLIEF